MENSVAIAYNSKNMKPLPDVDLAGMCKELRTKAGYTQQEMADRLGTTIRTYQHWEAGTRSPNGHYTAKLFLLRDELVAKQLRKAQ